MTVEDFKKQLKKIGFNEDRTSECSDMLVNLHFEYPIDMRNNRWIYLRCVVLFFMSAPNPYFQVQIATVDNKRFKWSTWISNLDNAPNAPQVLAYAIGDIMAKYRNVIDAVHNE